MYSMKQHMYVMYVCTYIYEDRIVRYLDYWCAYTEDLMQNVAIICMVCQLLGNIM